MLGEQYRKKMRATLITICKPLAVLPLTPNQFSALSIPLAFIAAFFIARHRFGIGFVFLFLALLVDLLDGTFATLKKQKTVFGNYWDAVVDKIVESILYVGFSFVEPVLAVLALASSMLESFAKPRTGLVIITDNHDWPAIGERSDRLLVLSLGVLLAAVFPRVSDLFIQTALGLVFVVTTIGFVQRVQYARQLIQHAEKKGELLPYLQKKQKKENH